MDGYGEQLSFDDVMPVTGEVPSAPKLEPPNFDGEIIARALHSAARQPEPASWASHEEEVDRRERRETVLDDHTSLNPRQAAAAAGTVTDKREFRARSSSHLPAKPKRISPRERAWGDVIGDDLDPNVR